MKLLSLALFILFTFSLQASTLVYKSYEMNRAPLELADRLSFEFKENGFFALADTTTGIPSLGLNQVFFKTESQFVLVKYGIEGEVPLEELISTPTGFMIHKKDKDQIYMLYFRGMNRDAVIVMLHRLSKKVSRTKMLQNLIISSAHADDSCGATGSEVFAQASELQGISAATAWQSLKACMSGVGSGVSDSTWGVAKGVSNELISFFSNPINYVEKVADTVGTFLVKTATFIKGLITNPEETFNQMGRGLGKAWDSVKSTVVTMSSEMKINFVCSFIGSLGVDAAIAFFTGGAGTSKIAATIARLAKKFETVASLMKTLTKFETSLSKLKLQGVKLEKFMKGLFHNNIPEDDLIHLNEMAHMNGELSLRTLACYIH